MITEGTMERALKLLGNGVSQEATAAALGVSPSYITQLLSIEEFADAVTSKRYENLQQHNERDGNYDEIEDRLIEKLQQSIPLMIRPVEILKGIQVINAAKRRGASAPETLNAKSVQVNLTIPTQVIQKFTQNINNQVIAVSGQELITIDSKSMLNKIESKSALLEETNIEPKRITA